MNFNIVPDEQRPAFPGKHFGNALFDTTVFCVADRLIKDYRGSYWDYVELDADEPGHVVAFMSPRGQTITLVNPFSGAEVEVDDKWAGMIVTSYALLWSIEQGNIRLYESHDRLNRAIVDLCREQGRMDVWFDMMD